MGLIELAFIRNQLYNNKFSEEYMKTLLDIRNNIDSNLNPFYGLIESCISYAIECINSKQYTAAAEELNLIHNFPMYGDFDTFDSRHFFTIELLGYIEKSNEESRIRQVCKEIAKFC